MRWYDGVMQAAIRALSLIFALTAGMGCSKLKLDADTRARYDAVVVVTVDKGGAVEGAEITHNNTKVGVTSAEGKAALQFVGNEGEQYDLTVNCPAGLQSPTKPVRVTLRRLADASRKPEYTATCTPATQVAVVAIRAENGVYLPVLYNGKEIGRTDYAGAASVALRLPPNETFELKLGTDEKGNLKPQNPSMTFTLKGQDQVFQFDQKFAVERKIIKAGPAKKGPQRL